VRPILIRSAVVLAAGVIAWLLGAHQISLTVDRLFTYRLYSMPVMPLAYSLDTLWFDEFPLDLSSDVRPIDVHVNCASGNRATLSSDGRRFALGRCTSRLPKATGEFQFTSDPGDALSLDVSRSLVSWPTPFELNFMTGQSPTWRRDLYYRLEWKKPSGAKLVMVWRFEQGFYPNDGWSAGTMTRVGSTGLLAVDIVGEPTLSPVN
jgi:hypothetical protein